MNEKISSQILYLISLHHNACMAFCSFGENMNDKTQEAANLANQKFYDELTKLSDMICEC